MVDRSANVSATDRAAIDQLREAVKDEITPYYDTDFNLLRWLIGHDYNIEMIKPKLLNHLLLRKYPEWQLETMASRPRDHPVHRHWQSGLTGDAVRTPHTIVDIAQTGKTDWWGLLQSYPPNEVIKARIHDLEMWLARVMEAEKRTGERHSILFIMDLTDLKFDSRMPKLISGGLDSISQFMADHYVELIHSFVVVGVPSFIHMLWTLARPLLPERSKRKVNILGSNWKHEIQSMVDPAVLPSFWNEPGKEEVFKAELERPVPVPEECLYKPSPRVDAQLLSVKAGSVGYIEEYVRAGQKIEYVVEADGKFGFACYYSPDPENDDPDTTKWAQIYPLFPKIPGPTWVPVKDSIHITKTGTYRCWFSNAHAWFHTLRITYTFRVVDDVR